MKRKKKLKVVFIFFSLLCRLLKFYCMLSKHWQYNFPCLSIYSFNSVCLHLYRECLLLICSIFIICGKSLLIKTYFPPLKPCFGCACILPIVTKILKVRPTCMSQDFSFLHKLWFFGIQRRSGIMQVSMWYYLDCSLIELQNKWEYKLVNFPGLPQNEGWPSKLSQKFYTASTELFTHLDIFFFFKSQNIFTSPEIKETEIPRNRRKIKMMRKTKGKGKKGDLRTNTRQ